MSASSSSSSSVVVNKPLTILEEVQKMAPPAPFVSDPATYVEQAGSLQIAMAQLETSMRNFSALEKRYKEDRLRKQQQLPDVEATLSTLRLLQERSKNPDAAPLKVQYELCDTLYAKASIQKTENVFLWLGADTFVEYSVDDAVGLLELQLKNANHLISELHLIIDYFKDQRNTTQVNIARIHNFGVDLRKRNVANA